jgi:hypothetical protein
MTSITIESTPADGVRPATTRRRRRVDVAVALPLLVVEVAWLALLAVAAFELLVR